MMAMLAAMTEREYLAHQQKYNELHFSGKDVRKSLENFMWKLQRALRAEKNLEYEQQYRSKPVTVHSNGEKNIDTFAWELACICGFNELPLQLTATGLNDKKSFLRGHEFKLFRQPIAAVCDLFVVRNTDTRGPQKLVIIFEDKLETTMKDEGHLGQIAAELLMLQYQNLVRFKHPASTVYAVRVVNSHMSFFALHATMKQMTAFCLSDVASAITCRSKLQIRYHCSKPRKAMGLDLADDNQRHEAMRVMSAIRADVLT